MERCIQHVEHHDLLKFIVSMVKLNTMILRLVLVCDLFQLD